MKKFVTLFGIFLFFHLYSYSQVGINTANPEQLFHIDPLGNNNAPGSRSDDVVITSTGNVGLGTIAPNNKLDVEGNTLVKNNMAVKGNLVVSGTGYAQKIGIGTSEPTANIHLANTGDNAKLRISDSSEYPGNILTANKDGYAYWDGLRAMSSVDRGSLKDGVNIPKGASVSITQDSLSLAPGRWLIIAKSGIADDKRSLEGFYIYMYLMAEKGFKGSTSNDPVIVGGSGSSAELDGAHAAAPHLVTIIDVPVKANENISTTKFWINLITSGPYGTITSSDYGPMQFYALRIDRPL